MKYFIKAYIIKVFFYLDATQLKQLFLGSVIIMLGKGKPSLLQPKTALFS